MEARDYLTTIETEPGERSTDMDNEARLVDDYGQHIRHVEGWGWVLWDGKRWKVTGKDGPIELAKRVVYDLRREAAETQDYKRREALWKHAQRSASYERIRGMVNLAKSNPLIQCRVEDFDTDPWLLNVENGTIDLRTGDLRKHNPADLITRMSPVTYDENAKSDDWDGFLADITRPHKDAPPRPELMEYLQRALGYSLTGRTDEECFFIPFGSGRNGKSKLLESVRYVLGDYAETIDPETVLSKAERGSTSPDVAKLAGARLVVTSEPDKRRKLDISRIKRFTGGDAVAASFKYENEFTFVPVFKLWFLTNHKPVIEETTNAAWQRIKLVPFDAYFGDNPDKKMGEKLRTAAPAILAWMVQGCLNWQESGLKEPEDVKMATQAYRSEEDVLAEFFEDCCITGGHVERPVLWRAYEAWQRMQSDGEEPVKKSDFFRMVEEHSFKLRKLGGKMCFLGVSLKPDSTTPRPFDDDNIPF